MCMCVQSKQTCWLSHYVTQIFNTSLRRMGYDGLIHWSAHEEVIQLYKCNKKGLVVQIILCVHHAWVCTSTAWKNSWTVFGGKKGWQIWFALLRITIPSNVLNRAAKFTFYQTFKNLNQPRSNVYFDTLYESNLFRCQHTTSKTV